jgi:hypothetical protein
LFSIQGFRADCLKSKLETIEITAETQVDPRAIANARQAGSFSLANPAGIHLNF